MTDQEIIEKLKNDNIGLRTLNQFGEAIVWHDPQSKNYISVPIADHDKKLVDIVNDHPTLTPEEKQTLLMRFVYVMVVTVDGEGIEQPYGDLTLHEFEILYVGSGSGIWVDKADNSKQYKLIQIPVMDDHTGERADFKLFGKGYTTPDYTIYGTRFTAFKLLEQL